MIFLRLGPRAVPVVLNAVAVAVVIDVVAVGAVVVGLAAGLLVVPGFFGSLHRLPIPCAGHGSVSLPRIGARGLRGTVVPSRTVRFNFGPCRWGSMRLGRSVVDGLRDLVAVPCLNGVGSWGGKPHVSDFEWTWRGVGGYS